MQIQKKQFKDKLLDLIIFFILGAFLINPFLGLIAIFGLIFYFFKNKNALDLQLSKYAKSINAFSNNLARVESTYNSTDVRKIFLQKNQLKTLSPEFPKQNLIFKAPQLRLEKRKRYLQVALNNTINEAIQIISQIPYSKRILIEVGTPMIKEYGIKAISEIKQMAPLGSYIVADNKCADLGSREVEMMANAGANASTCLGVAPIETIDTFIEECEKYKIDSMIDMMNVEDPLSVLKKLKKLPRVVILHRGVDESEFSKEKQIPYYQIKQIKGNYNLLVSVAGGDTLREIQRAIFNDADIVVIWKSVYKTSENTAQLIKKFLKEIK